MTANANAMGITSCDMGFDVMHFNLHKVTPHEVAGLVLSRC